MFKARSMYLGGTHIEATQALNYAHSRELGLRCPECGEEVNLIKPKNKNPYFAHYSESKQNSKGCSLRNSNFPNNTSPILDMDSYEGKGQRLELYEQHLLDIISEHYLDFFDVIEFSFSTFSENEIEKQCNVFRSKQASIIRSLGYTDSDLATKEVIDYITRNNKEHLLKKIIAYTMYKQKQNLRYEQEIYFYTKEVLSNIHWLYFINNKYYLRKEEKLQPKSVRDEQIRKEREKAKIKNRKINVKKSVAGNYRERGFFNKSFTLYYKGLVETKKILVKKDSPYKLEVRGSEVYLILSIENKQFNFEIKIGEIISHTRDSYWWNAIPQIVKKQDGQVDYKNNDDIAQQLNKNEHYYDGTNIVIKEKTKGKVAIDETGQEIAHKKYCGKLSAVFIDLNYDICTNESSIKVFNDIKNRLHKGYIKHNGNQHCQTVKYKGKQRQRIKKNVKYSLQHLLGVNKQNKYADTIASRMLSYYELGRFEFYEAKRHLSQQDANSLRKLVAVATGIDPLEDIE